MYHVNPKAMAINHEGILGPFSGKVGPVVGTTWRGKPIVRSAPAKSSKPPSPLQLRNQERFLVVEGFLNPMSEFLSSSFSIPFVGKAPRNLASSFNNPAAVDDTGPAVTMVYSKALLSQGIVCAMEAPTASLDAPDVLRMDWADNSNQAMAEPDDVLFAVVHVPALKAYEYYNEAATRTDGTALLQLPQGFAGQEMHCWAGFRTTDGKAFSNSRYVGVV